MAVMITMAAGGAGKGDLWISPAHQVAMHGKNC